MCLAMYVVGFTLKYEWSWMSGVPFNLFYMFALVGVVVVPLLILVQCIKMGKLWLNKKTPPLDQVVLLLLSTILYGALLVFRKKVFDW